MQTGRSARTGSVGNLVVIAMLIGLAIDVISRFVSYDSVTFRAWEAMTRRGRFSCPGPFEPNKRYVNLRSYGDLSFIGNLPDVRDFRPEIFTTDSLGFRNARAPDGTAPVGITVGTSLTAGAGLSDDETLASRLTALVGGFVYNAGYARDVSEQGLDALVAQVGLRSSGTIVYEYREISQPPTPGSGPLPVAKSLRVERLFGSLPVSVARGWLQASPLEFLLRRERRRVEDDVILPNSHESNVYRATLSNGEPMLFLQDERRLKEPGDDVLRLATQYWSSLAEHLAAEHVRLIVVLVPSKWTVYGPLVRDPRQEPVRETFLPRLAALLSETGVPVVDLSRTFRAEARDDLAAGRTLYWNDDTHWSPAGAALAAQEIARRWGQGGSAALDVDGGEPSKRP
jgi:hypothetical protein